MVDNEQVRDGLDLPFEAVGDFDQINWVVWKQQLTRIDEIGFNGPETRAKAHFQDTSRTSNTIFLRASSAGLPRPSQKHPSPLN